MRSVLRRNWLKATGVSFPTRYGAISQIPRVSLTSQAKTKVEAEPKRPAWLEAIFYDKRTYFEDVRHIEKSFLTGVKANSSRKAFSFSFDNAPDARYRHLQVSYVALRDSCRCPECFDPSPQQRDVNMLDANLNEHPLDFDFDKLNQLLHVTWADGHRSVFSGPWIHATFTPHPLFEYPRRKLWRASSFKEQARHYEYDQITSKPEEMLNCLKDLAIFGLAFVKNAPTKAGTVGELISHINYPRSTHFGDFWQVESKANVTNVAYNHAKLTQHIDLPYFSQIPEVQFFHCIRQSDAEGGESTFADGFAAAEWLRKNNKPVFKTLTETKLGAYCYASDVSDAFLMLRKPPITLRPNGSIKRIVFSNSTFDSLRHLSVGEQQKFVEALQCYMEMLETKEYCLMTKMEEGDMVLFDNTRVTHGREAFDPRTRRFLEGCYVDWDEIFSRMRMIQSKIFRKNLASYYASSK